MRSKLKWIYTLLLALTMQFSFAQEKIVTGVVSDGSGPVPGANVIVKGSTKGIQTDANGKYAIEAKVGDVLVFSFVGNQSTATVGTSNVINVKLQDAVKLDNVVVEGYRTTTKATTTVAQTTVKAATIENRPNASFMATLQGQVAGLNISSGSGQPGAKTSVLIRGVSSVNASTDPLYVIDGMPTNGDNFRSINPNDIESTTVLKDASATAIYGNRGTNGVIVVRTKRGSATGEKTKFRYSTSYGMTMLQKSKYQYANSSELLTLEKRYGVGLGVTLTDDQIANYNTNTDWVKQFFETATSTDHQFSIENSGKNLRAYTSISYLDQKGILSSTGLKRFTFKNSINGMSSDEKFNYSTNLTLGFSNNFEASSLGSGAINNNVVLGAYLAAPYVTPDQYKGSQDLYNLYQTSGSLLYTPLFLMDKLKTSGNNTDEIRMLASSELSYKVLKDLTFRTRTGMELLETRALGYTTPLSFNGLLFKNPAAEFGGNESISNRREYRFNHLWQLDYKKSFYEKHTINALLNMEYNYAQVQNANQNQVGLDPRTYVPGTGAGYLADIASHDFYGGRVNSSMLKYNMVSYFGILDYDYDNKYGVVGSYRMDKSSRFNTGYQDATFWSVGTRWNVNNESFMKKQNIFQVLKARVSYGITGNQRINNGTEFSGINPPGFLDTYANSSNVYNGQNGYGISFGYTPLSWESTSQFDAGIDFEVLKSRLRGTFDFYNKITRELFFAVPVSPITGTTNFTKNSNVNLVNKGVELSLFYDVFRSKDFKLTLRANGSYNKNYMANIIDNGGVIINGNSITHNGGQISEFYTLQYAGVNPATGNLWFKAADGSLTESPSIDKDRISTGKSALPQYQGGFGFDADYKGFFLTTTFTFVAKVWRYDYDYAGFMDPTQLGQFTVSPELLNAWTPTNTTTDIPALNASNLGTSDDSDRFLFDASYIRMRHLQLGYRVPNKFLEKTFISGLSFYIQGQNLVTFTKWRGYDAESSRGADQGQYPTPRIYTVGLDLKF